MDRLDHAMQAAEVGDFARALVFLQPYPFDATMDQERAFKLFCFIASKGYTQAYYWVGICYELGSGVAMDLSRAHACFQMGADAQDADCILRQAYLYEQGLGVAQDLIKAASLRSGFPGPKPQGGIPGPSGGTNASGHRTQSKMAIPTADVDFTSVWVRKQPAAPPYPPVARIARIQGTVVVQITIGPDGVPMVVRALEGPIQLRSTAEDYAWQWRFGPCLINGVAQTARFTLNMPFKLR